MLNGSPSPRARRTRAMAAMVGIAGLACAALAQPSAPAPASGPAAQPPAPAAAPDATKTPAPNASSLILRRVGALTIPLAEITTYEPSGKRAFATSGGYVNEVDLRRPPWPGLVRMIDLSTECGFGTPGTNPAAFGKVTSVAVDPAGRNVAAAAVRPPDFADRAGVVVFFHTPTGTVLKRLTVGFSPRCVTFTPDGQKLIVLNQGEATADPDGTVIDPPGTISIIDLSDLEDAETMVRHLDPDRITTVSFEGPALDRALAKDAPESDRPNGAAIRIHPKNKDNPARDLEPSSIAIMGSSAYVTLRPNNAIAVIDLNSKSCTRIAALGTIDQTIDASDMDGGIKISQKVTGLAMPDGIAAYQANGHTYLVTANSGDNRGEANDRRAPLGDRGRARDQAKWNHFAAPLMSTADLSDPVLGRLYISTIDGDTDGDGKTDTPTMFGTRSMSIWDAQTLKRVSDTGSAFEQLMADKAKELFNAERIGTEDPPVFQFDNRSAERGPDPNGVAVAPLGGRTYAFVTLAYPGAVVTVDVTDPSAPRPVDIAVGAKDGDVAARGVVFVPAEQSATSEPMVLVCSESSGVFTVYRVIVK